MSAGNVVAGPWPGSTDSLRTAIFADWKRREDAGTPLVGRLRWVLAWRLRVDANIVTFEELADRSGGDLLAIPGIGPRRLEAVRQAMARQGFALRPGVSMGAESIPEICRNLFRAERT